MIYEDRLAKIPRLPVLLVLRLVHLLPRHALQHLSPPADLRILLPLCLERDALGRPLQIQ